LESSEDGFRAAFHFFAAVVSLGTGLRHGAKMATLDHDERRRRIAEVVVDVIAREGLDAATVRRIAAAVGCSTTVVTHYFADKDDLLFSAYHIMSEIAATRFEQVYRRDPGDVVGYLMSMSALEPADLALWRSFIAIWDRSLRDPAFADELHSWIDEALLRIQVFIKVLNPQCADPTRVARRLFALIYGISVQLVFDPQSWSHGAVRHALTTEVESLVGKPESIRC
jgi:TetR/AcrR family transcriptional regulator, transcriptional repressor of bet genes